MDPDSYAFDFLVGSAYQEVGEAQEAVQWFRRMVEKSRRSPQAYYHLAAAEARIGHFAGARAAYERVLELDPGEREAQRGLANVERLMDDVLGPESYAEHGELEAWE